MNQTPNISTQSLGGISSALAGGDFFTGMASGIISSGLNHAMHAGSRGVGDAIMEHQEEKRKEEKSGVLTNNSKEAINYKPDDPSETQTDWGAYELKPGESTDTPVDAINVAGKVYKVRHGYYSITVTSENKVQFDYPFYYGLVNDRVEGKDETWLKFQMYNTDGTQKYFEYPAGSDFWHKDTQWWNIFYPNNQIPDPRF